MVSFGELEREREKILEEIGLLGSMRRGSLAERYLPCGKAECRCHRPGARGHGPKYSLTRKVKGRTRTEYFSADQVSRVREQLNNHLRFIELSKALVEVGEQMSRFELDSELESKREGEKAISKKNSARRSKRKSPKRSTAF